MLLRRKKMFNIFVLTYILDNGINNVKEITDQEVEEFKKEKDEYVKSLKGTNRHPIATTEFEVEIIEKAREICNLERGEILTYIKKGMKSFK
jgi:vacuolar-type H+-ATPase subunit H